MTLVRETVTNAAVGVGVSHTPEGLSVIHRPDCAAAVWQRRPLPSFQSWIDGLEPDRLPKARLILPTNKVRDAVNQICDVCGTPDCPEREMLADDATALATIFSDIMPTSHLQLRFDVITTNACRKFHIDAVTARLVCTYRGSGTQYGISTDGAEPQRVFSVPTGSPMLLRGTLWPEEPKSGLLHRSPPIEGTGETRLLLVLDPVTDSGGRPDPKTLH
ncbi:MAG: DUF1826 domain-containing protein [Pseudomonadota bacterium]